MANINTFFTGLEFCQSSSAYLYAENDGASFKALDKNSLDAQKLNRLSIGKIVQIAHNNLPKNLIQDEDRAKLNNTFLALRSKIQAKRNCNAIKKIFITFLSCLYNYIQGFGFTDSLDLITGLLHELETRNSFKTTGEIEFSKEDQNLLLNIFSQPLYTKALQIPGRESLVTRKMFNKNVGTFDCFPNFVFKTGEGNNQKIHDRYQMTTKARQVCQEHQLNCLTVPRCSLIEMNCNGLPTAFLVEEKYDIKQGIPAQKNRYANEEEYLQEIARQLTILVCLTGFKDVKWDNISLMGDPPDLKVLLCDLEPHTYVPLKEAFIGWQNRGFGQNTPGLFVCLPKHAETIYQTAEKHLPKTTFETIKGDLEKGKTQAKAIITKRDDIKTFHQTHGVKKESPAIPDTFLDTFGDDERLPRATLKLIIEDINTVIRKQSESCFNLVDARGWRLTGDCETADSNWRQYICDHRYEIEEKLLPKLKEQGIIHSFVSSQQFRELPYTTLPGRVDELDMFIQF